ncbi:MAG: helix-turn-helix transcriptional regulator [Phaeodactylibacter sp.]|nr:helix-turn-helix transcriptional regulator [Phaeodactylibacter sp.]MCB9286598.1 helix-turn-helix transcriptional regulator [Lewinellaceae bacterium]
MHTPIILHNRLQDLYDSLGIPIEQDVEFTIHPIEEIHKETIRSPVFRANYYSFLFIETGKGKYMLGHREFLIRPGTIYFTNPGHLKSFETFEPYTGHMISFSEKFLKQNVHPKVFEDFPFLLAETVPPGYLEPDEYAEFKKILLQILEEARSGSAYKYKIVGNLFVVLLLKVKERFWKDYDPLHESDRGSEIVNTFRQNLERTYRELISLDRLPNVQDYAEQQQLHPNYFNTVIKSKTGKSANTWITEKTIAEAQALLSQSQLTIKEIAYHLKFSEPTHFSKFFKKHCGVPPTRYRREL